jgi:hypothetical protein
VQGKNLSWNPINPEHAIERVRIVAPFAPEMPPKVVNSLGNAIDIKARNWGFSGRSPNETGEMAFDPHGRPMMRIRRALRHTQSGRSDPQQEEPSKVCGADPHHAY